jgi:hypothetical protein
MRWAYWLWPGLPQLWLDGAWSGLLLAIGFALLLNLLLLATLVWEELLGGPLLTFGWTALGAIWIGTPILSSWERWRETPQQDAPPSEDLFRQAQREYLKGNWFETESLLVRRLTDVPRDVESRLLLATMLRRVGRLEEARSHLADLAKLNASALWHVEMDEERRRIEQAEKERRSAGAATV